MLKRLWTGGLAGGGAIVLVFALTGMVAAATLVTTLTAPDAAAPVVVDTTATFEDVDGNGTDDDCQEGLVVANAEAEAAAAAAVDTNADGTVSVPEAAHSDRTGGTNCNHGGYVSSVANDDAANETEDAEETADATPTDCEATGEVAAPVTGTETETEVNADEAVVADEPAANAHGTAVSEVAKSDAIGGKNCNHGGAVSEAAHDKAAQDAAKAARAAARVEAKAARDAARAEAKAARAAARVEAKAARDAARAERKANHAKAHGG